MPRTAFVSDLQQVQNQSPLSCVTDIKKGEDDGSFTYKVTPDAYSTAIEITVLIPELTDYPSDHDCYLYTTSDGIPKEIADAISSLAIHGMKVSQIIETSATIIVKALQKRGQKRPRSTPDNGSDGMDVDSQSEAETLDGDEGYDDNISIGGWSNISRHSSVNNSNMESLESQVAGNIDPLSCEYLQSFCQDLRAAKAAGFKVGCLGNLPGGSGYLAISIRISKLDISDEAMAAWRLNPKKYLILLMHYPIGYKPLSAMVKDSHNAKRWVQVYVGTSARYKPSLSEAITAFTKVRKFKNDQDGNIHVFKSEGSKLDVHGLSDSQADPSATTFEGTFISRPVSELLNERFLALVMYRLAHSFPWDGAEAFYEDFQGRERADIIEEKYFKEENSPAHLARVVTDDALQSGSKPEDVSLPLIAMQYMLRHFVRCTEFCLVCHNKINVDFEALKPYVCSRPLCLYQYMALGFGPSMEYEILDQPSVIDLLICFCYAAAKQGKLKDFPLGLNLIVPVPGSTPFPALYDKSLGELTVTPLEGTEAVRLNVGDWIVVHAVGYPDFVHCRVMEADYFPKVRLTVLPSHGLTTVFHADANATSESNIKPSSTIFAVNFAIYYQSFDELTDLTKRASIVQLLDTLPSVNEMREWLTRNTKVGEEASLRNWKTRLSPSALLLLRWIVASNRSCIVQIDEMPEDPQVNTTSESSEVAIIPSEKGATIREERVHGMDGFIQFRFAMGAPDKEQRFVNQVRSAVLTSDIQYPTLFAFHGSPLSNWHSIIREGLHFNETSNGRAFGHGVYHSLDALVSMGYTRGRRLTTQEMWPKSPLNITAALCLNEIVNLPNQFVSKAPHLVVNQLDWIQTRYLFVQTTSFAHHSTYTVASEAPTPARPLPQDSAMTPRGMNRNNLIIPETASTVRSKNGNNRNISKPGLSSSDDTQIVQKVRTGLNMVKDIVKFASGSHNDPIIVDEEGYASNGTDDEDINILFVDDRVKSQHIEKQERAVDGKKLLKKRADPNEFSPGSLDISTVQLLAEPSYASPLATKRIQQELKNLLKIQDTHNIAELGWYIDRQHIDNVYQWIIELHSFDSHLPLASDMKKLNVKSIVMETRFGKDFPMTPPFFRVIKPRFRPFSQKGGGHVTAGGALCMELLTNSGWSAVSSLESVLLQIRMAMSSTEPYPARLEGTSSASYSPFEAKDAFIRACRTHGWQIPPDFHSLI